MPAKRSRPAAPPAAAPPISAVIGYARTSTIEQMAGIEAQERDLRTAGCTHIFAEQVSSVVTQRPQLMVAMDYLRAGDVLVVTKPDRLARSTADLLGIMERLNGRGIGLRILSMGGTEMDTRSATGKLMLTMLGAVATFERELMLERQREGIRAAVEAGKYTGRAPPACRQAKQVAWATCPLMSPSFDHSATILHLMSTQQQIGRQPGPQQAARGRSRSRIAASLMGASARPPDPEASGTRDGRTSDGSQE